MDGKVHQLLYGDDNFDGCFVEEESLRTLEMNNKQLAQHYQWRTDLTCCSKENVSVEQEKVEPELAQKQSDEQNSMTPRAYKKWTMQLQNPTIVSTMKDEWDRIRFQRDTLRHSRLRSKLNHHEFHSRFETVVPFQRLLHRAMVKFNIHNSSSNKNLFQNRRSVLDSCSDMTPYDSICMLRLALAKLTYDNLLRGMNSLNTEESTSVAAPSANDVVAGFEALVCDWFSSHSIVYDCRLTRRAFSWVLNRFREYVRRGIVAPGEMIGCVAAHSIGQSLTQMTLNTFHYTGLMHNCVMGIPRFEEIISTGKNNTTKKALSSSMTVFLKHEHSVGDRLFPTEEVFAKQIANALPDILLQDAILSCSVTSLHPDHVTDQDRVWAAEDERVLQSRELWQPILEINEDAVWSDWVIRIVLNKPFCTERMLTPAKIVDEIQHRMFRGIHHEWLHSCVVDEQWVIRFRMDESCPQFLQLKTKHANQYQTPIQPKYMYQVISQRLLNDIHIHGIKDIKSARAKKMLVRSIDASTGTLLTKEEWIIETEGANFAAILQYPEVDASRTVCNDIMPLARVLGIGAASTWIEEQVRQVLSFNGITVGKRHLRILASTMTHSGRVLPFNRHGILKMNKSFLAQCAFETTADVLEKAAQTAANDPLCGVTENGVVGNAVEMGK